MIQKSYNSGSYVAYTYNAEGSLARLSYGDSTGELASYRFEYDSLGRLIRSAELDADGGTVQRTEHIYDGYNRLSRQSWTLGDKTYSESYVYDDPSDTNQNGDGASDTNKNGDGALTQMTTATGAVIDYQYDTLRRLTRSKVALNGSTVYTTAYAFRDLDASRTTTQVQYRNVRSANGTMLEGKKYTYDALGNITRISQRTKPFYTLVAYEYDAQNQLTKETYYDGKGTATKNIKLAYYYDYDTAGNILRVEKGTVNSSGVLTKTLYQIYNYNDSEWHDLLGSISFGSTSYVITYDHSGNPDNYVNKHALYSEMTWERGRLLTSVSVDWDDYSDLTFRYDANGIRTEKTYEAQDEAYTSSYLTQSGKVVREAINSRNNATCILDFVYDESGRPFALYYSSNGGNSFATYYYILNLQGDVVKLVTESGAVAASYEYDAWGNILSSSGSMAETNPLRYRGYYYDSETGFYYLQSRYYDPTNHRFINADSYTSTGQGFLGYNMFAYCGNNPVRRSDPTGTWFGEDVLDWLEDTFGVAVYETNTYDAISIGNIFGGEEHGVATSGVIAGDNNKPVVLYVQLASKWWHVWEYGVGITYNPNSNDSVSIMRQSTGGGSISWSHGNAATEIGANWDRISYTTFMDYNKENRTASFYHQ